MNQFQEYKFIKNRFKKDNDYLIKKYIKTNDYQGLITSYSNETYPRLMKHKNMMIKIFFFRHYSDRDYWSDLVFHRNPMNHHLVRTIKFIWRFNSWNCHTVLWHLYFIYHYLFYYWCKIRHKKISWIFSNLSKFKNIKLYWYKH